MSKRLDPPAAQAPWPSFGCDLLSVDDTASGSTAGWRRHGRWLLPLASVAAILAAIVVLGRWPSRAVPATGARVPGGYVALAMPPGTTKSGEVPRVGRPVPAFALPGVDGAVIGPADFAGRVIVLNFWATWCPPCRQEMPLLAAAQQQYGERGLMVLTVDVGEDADAVKTFLAQLGVRLSVALDAGGDVAQQYRVLGLPTSYLIDRHGIIRSIKIGEFRQTDLRQAIARLLAAE